MSKIKQYLAWRRKMVMMTPEERKQLEVNQWIWLRYVFAAFLLLAFCGDVEIYREGHGFRFAHIAFNAMMVYAVYKSWSLKMRRDAKIP